MQLHLVNQYYNLTCHHYILIDQEIMLQLKGLAMVLIGPDSREIYQPSALMSHEYSSNWYT